MFHSNISPYSRTENQKTSEQDDELLLYQKRVTLSFSRKSVRLGRD